MKKRKICDLYCHSIVSSKKSFLFCVRTLHERFLDPQSTSMDRTVVPGLEVAPSMGPQVAAQLDENKYYIGSERWNFPGPDQLGYSDFDRPNQSNGKPQLKSQSFVKIIGVLIAVLLLAVALGVGLGVGLSAQHKQKLSK